MRAAKRRCVIVRPVLCRPFVGRREELAYLRDRRLEAGASKGAFVLIAGDAGVGKSRLMAEFCDSLVSSRWKTGHGACLEFASQPYGPILEVLENIDAKPYQLASAATKRAQFDAIADRFAAIASRRALAIVIEDLHWADAASLDFIAYLATKIHRMRVLVLASFRADEVHTKPFAAAALAKIARNARTSRIDLAPLRGPELRTFINEALAGTDVVRRNAPRNRTGRGRKSILH